MFYFFSDEYQTTLENEFESFLFENDFKAIMPESFLVLASLLLLIYGVIYSGHKQKPEHRFTSIQYPVLVNNISWLGQLSVFFTVILLIHNPLSRGVLLYNSLVIDDFTLFLKILLLFGTFFSVLISVEYIQQESLNSFEMIVLILLSTCSMLFLVSSTDFITMYLAIELQSLCFYVMAALKRNSEFSTEAGLKYFLLGAFSSGVLLFGCSLIYGFTGVTNFAELSKIFTCIPSESLLEGCVASEGGTTASQGLLLGLSSLRGCELGMIFILVGFLFKLTAVPFHMWAPDVYEGAPTSVTAFFSIVPKVSVLAVFLRLFFESFYNFMLPWQHVLIFCSISSMLLGSLAALSQNKIKRLLAFSSIGHVGYLLIGFCCGTIEGIQALLIYLVVYIVMTINLFAIVLSPLRRDVIEHSNNYATIAKQKDVWSTQQNSMSTSSTLTDTYQPTVEEHVKQASKQTNAVFAKQLDKTKNKQEAKTVKDVFSDVPNVINSKNRKVNSPASLAKSEHVVRPAWLVHPESTQATSTKIQRVKYTTDLAMLAKSNPILAFTLTITMFSIAGIPPLAGFYSKTFLMFAAVSSSQYVLAVVAVLTSVISCFYYIRIVKIMYFESPAHWLSFMQISKETSIALGCTFAFLLFFFLYPAPLFLVTHKVALSLCY